MGTKQRYTSVLLSLAAAFILSTCIGAKSQILKGALGEAEENAKNKDCKQTKAIVKKEVEKNTGRKY